MSWYSADQGHETVWKEARLIGALRNFKEKESGELGHMQTHKGRSHEDQNESRVWL